MNYDFLVIAIVVFFISLLYPSIKTLIMNKRKKPEINKYWAISYYAHGPNNTELIGISTLEAPSKEVAEMRCILEVAMKSKGTVVKSTVITQIGTVTKKDLPVDPSWQDLKENV